LFSTNELIETMAIFSHTILLLLLSSLLCATSVRIVHTSYQIQSANLLGRELTTANFKLALDEDLYLTLPDFCLAPQECPRFGESSEDFCDYSRKDSLCGVPMTNTTSKGCLFPENCDSSQAHWTVLTPNQPVRGVELQAHQTVYYRFYFNQTCSGFRLTLNRVYGSSSFGLKRGGSVKNLKWDRRSVGMYFANCPATQNYGYGTYFLGVGSSSTIAKFDLELEFFEINTTNPKRIRNESEVRCSPNSGVALCPKWGEPFQASVVLGGVKVVTVAVPQCSQFLIYHEVLSASGTLVMLFKQDSPAVSASGFSVPLSRHPFVINVCPTNVTSSSGTSSLWITFATEVSSLQFLFYISNDPDEWGIQRVPLSSIGSTISGREFIDGLVQVSCLGQTFPCYPGADTFGSCQMAWNPMPRTDGNFLWPIPRLFADSLTSKVFYEDSESEERERELFVSNEILATFLLESYYETQSIVPLADWESQCFLSFPTLSFFSTNTSQIPLGNVGILGKYEEVSCSDSKFQELSKKMNYYSDLFRTAQTIEQIITLRFDIDVLTFEPEWQVCDHFVQTLLISEQELVIFPKSTTCSVDMMKNATLLSMDAC